MQVKLGTAESLTRAISSSSYSDMDSEPHDVSAFASLPYELVGSIIQHLDTRTLLSVCLAGKALYQEAVPHLYRYIEYGRAELLHLKFLPVLIANPKLAALVHVYHSDTIAKRHTVHARRAEGPMQLWNLTLQAIPLMINLQRLRFRDWNGLSSVQILKTARFQLVDFDWGCAFEGKELADFLATQTKLRHIVFAPDSFKCALDPKACETIKSIGGSYATISNLLPGCSGVEHLRWFPDQGEHQYWTEDLESDTPIGQSMQCVVSLSLGGFGVRPLLPYFGSTLTSLRSLELYNIDIQVIYFQVSPLGGVLTVYIRLNFRSSSSWTSWKPWSSRLLGI